MACNNRTMSNKDTNQASELFELCKEVYEKTGWKPTDWQHGIEDGQPLYTSDYLLEKLPKKNIILTFDEFSCTWRTIYGADIFSTDRFRGNADTPLKALLKLTIALSEAGELK